MNCSHVEQPYCSHCGDLKPKVRRRALHEFGQRIKGKTNKVQYCTLDNCIKFMECYGVDPLNFNSTWTVTFNPRVKYAYKYRDLIAREERKRKERERLNRKKLSHQCKTKKKGPVQQVKTKKKSPIKQVKTKKKPKPEDVDTQELAEYK